MAHATGRSDHSVALGHADRASRTRHRVWRCCHRRRPHRYGRWSMVDGRGSLLARLQTKTTLERPTHVLLAGLVNAHTHAAMSLLRDAPPLRISVQEWLRRSIWPLEQRWVSAEFVRMGTQLYFAQPQRAGVTCMADMYFFPEESARNAPQPCPARCAPDAASRYTGSRAGTRCCERNRLAGAGQAGRSDCGQPATPRRLLEDAGNADITDSWVGGDAVLEQGRSRTLDIDELRDRARFWSERLQQEANQ